tara:strand:+ start:483 stop:602 length:120 start_codon:yes stop_codon:yes gene_type:complete
VREVNAAPRMIIKYKNDKADKHTPTIAHVLPAERFLYDA